MLTSPSSSFFFFFSSIHFLHLHHLRAHQTSCTGAKVVAYTEKSQVKHETRHIQLVREYGFHPRTKASVGDGSLLPKKFEPFPENMYGRPLEEIDTFIYEEVCVLHLQKHIIVINK